MSQRAVPLKEIRNRADMYLRRANTVTLLLLLVSIAVLEYVLRRPNPAPGWDKKTLEDRKAESIGDTHHQSSNPTLAPDLFHLGRAVEQFGRGPVPEPGAAKPAPKERQV
jgi:hypothetical protein